MSDKDSLLGLLAAARGTDPVPVEIVRTKAGEQGSVGDSLGKIANTLAATLLTAWIVMLLAPLTILDITPGYWETFATVWVARSLFVGYEATWSWTRKV